MAGAMSGETNMMNRWWRVAGALLMNLPLGALYAWSIFVLPLEKEFGWTRTQTFWISVAGSVLFSLGWVLATYAKGLFVTNTEGKATDDKIVNALPSAVCYAFR